MENIVKICVENVPNHISNRNYLWKLSVEILNVIIRSYILTYYIYLYMRLVKIVGNFWKFILSTTCFFLYLKS